MRTGVELFDVVERRPADHGVLPQHDRPADRDDRQPDADEHSVHAGEAAAATPTCHYPIAPQQTWHFRQSIDYSVTANYAVLDVVSRNRDTFLFNIYRMGKNSIERGNRNTWTATPRRILAAQASLAPQGGRGGRGAGGRCAGRRRGAGGRPRRRERRASAAATVEQFRTLLRDPNLRDPRGYILPADQPDFPTATKFVNALLKIGVTVHRATAPFTVAGKSYPAGSYVVKTAQAFRPHVLDMFEPQDHPNDIPYPGGPPTRPYDNAGWTLAYQMGVQFDRILDGFDGPFEKVSGLQKPAPGKVSDGERRGLSHEPRAERRVHGHQPPAGRGGGCVVDDERRAAGGVLHRVEAVHASRPRQALGRSGSELRASRRGPRATRSRCGRCESRSPISTAARCRPAGRAFSSSSSSFPSRWSTRRRSTRGTSPAGST